MEAVRFQAGLADGSSGEVMASGRTAVSTFYVLPPRAVLGERFARYLNRLFPGRSWTGADWPALADNLATTLTWQPDVYVVFEEDLPPGEEVHQALADGFGAQATDEVIAIPPRAFEP